MEGQYALTRIQLKILIERSNKTKDGNYWCPWFPLVLKQRGFYNDVGYTYERCFFEDFTIFNEDLLEYFMKKSSLRHEDMSKIEMIGGYMKGFYDNNKELATLNLKDVIPFNLYTLEELIDNFIYIKIKNI